MLDTNAHSAGITNYTQKTTNVGCYCHCSTANSATTVTISTTSTTFYTGQTYEFTASVSNSSEADGGIDISTEFGTLSAISGQGLYLSSGELTHSAPKALAASWNFDWTAPSTSEYDTIFATGNAVNGDGSNDGGNCTDKWNFAPKYIIHVIPSPTKRIAFGRSSISLGQVRVGHRVADSLLVSSVGTGNITISSSGMKSGTPFSSYPTTSNRTINSGSTEMDSVSFSPAARGSFSDSLIFNTNSDTAPEQRTGIAVSGEGIEAIFSASNGNSLAFGNLRAGNTAHLSFQYSNTGDDTLFLSAPSVSGSAFSADSGNSSVTLPPNQSASVRIAFSPTAKQSYSGSLTFSASNGVSTPTISLTGNGILPQLQISAPQDIGLIRVGQTLQGIVTFNNTGNDTLHISNARLTQPSTRFTLGAYTASVEPNGSGTFHISYTPDSERTDTATLHFSSDDPTDSGVSLVVMGSGILPHMAIAQKGDTIDLGQVRINSSDTQDIAVTNTGSADLNLVSVTAGPSPFALVSSPSVVASEVTSYIAISFSPTSTGGFHGMAVIQGDDPNNASDTVYLTGEGINSSLSITPASLLFGSVPVSSTAVDTVTLSNSGAATLNILDYKISPEGGAFAIIDSSGHQVTSVAPVRVAIRFQPDSAGSFSGMLTIVTDDASSPTRTVSLSGIGVKGSLSVLPATVDFGNVQLGQSASAPLTLRNVGQASLSVSSLTFTGPGAGAFTDSLFTTPMTISAGDSAKLDLLFTPSVAEAYQGMARFLLGDGTSVTAYLQGAGVSAGVSGMAANAPFVLSLSPNPARNMVLLHIGVERSSGISLSLLDAAGHIVTGRSLGYFVPGHYEVPLPLQTLPDGSYFIRIGDEYGNTVGASLVLER